MPSIPRASLFGRLSTVAYQAMENATLLCKRRHNPYVELAHWLHQLIELPDSDLLRIMSHYALDAARISRDLQRALERLPRQPGGLIELSGHVEDSVERAWVYASLLFDAPQVRTGHLLLAWLETPTLRKALASISSELSGLDPEDVAKRLPNLCKSSPEAAIAGEFAADDSGGSAEQTALISPAGKALERYTLDLTERARRGELAAVVGRETEIARVIQVLLRRRQNNPLLAGDAGVGKTAIVEGLALRITSGDVPPALRNTRLCVLDLGLLTAGAALRGEFESRLRQLIDEIHASPAPIILFIDEAHTLVGAGGNAGTSDAANLLKPALARGNLRTIAATTWSEYKQHIESDPALSRRFQVIKVEEPSPEATLAMLRCSAGLLAQHHGVLVLDEAFEAAVTLSQRYITDRRLPDKASSLLDTACARVAASQHGTPAAVESARRRVQTAQTELELLEREQDSGFSVGPRADAARAALARSGKELVGVEARWVEERALAGQLLTLQAELRQAGQSDPARAGRVEQLSKLRHSLGELHGESPWIMPAVDHQAIAAIITDWTGVPAQRLLADETQNVLALRERLAERVVGQDAALEAITRRVQTARAGLEDPGKPKGVFLLVGPSGVGKTETALALAEALYGGEHNLIMLNMSEFQEPHSVATLKGAPPGYVGYGAGGVLTEAVRRRPHSVVLLDEIEKAHPDVHELFFQVFDKGWLEDGQGTRVDFRHTMLLLTSNVGSDVVEASCRGGERPPAEWLCDALRKPLLQEFPAAFLGRLVVVPYYPLSETTLGRVIALSLERVRQRVEERYRVPFAYDESVVELIRTKSAGLENGGRTIDGVLTNTLLPRLSRELLERSLAGQGIRQVAVSAHLDGFRYAFE